MAQAQGLGRRYIKAFFKGFFVAVPVTVTFLDRVACVARVEGASMQPSLNPGGREASDVVLLNHWSIRNYDVQRGDIVSLVFLLDFYMPEPLIFSGLHNAGRSYSRCFLRSANHSTGSRSDLNAQA
ncbi:mitochondrial inner membrane protease subunit 2 isoform X12 [Taeniopygia guttata]|uniref:mitochondrial inner membrane protease subunit 2 isoform X12 n=1 Tax=Taeniopygia guttata TaxID=59729 RepID=UPI003BB95CFD